MFQKPFNLLPLFVLSIPALFLFGCNHPQDKTPALSKHVVLISIDGSRPEFYMDTSWHAPTLHRLMEEGVYAAKGIESVFPSLTAPSHATLITGAYPSHHGIYYNRPFQGKNKYAYRYDSSIKATTLWDAINKAGMTAAAIRWPGSLGAPVAYNAPVKFNQKSGQTLTYPYAKPKNLIKDFEKETGVKLTRKDLGHKNAAIQKTLGQIAGYIIETYQPNLVAIHLGVDHREHVYGKNAIQVKEGLVVVDSVIGGILQSIERAGIGDSTTVIITGDHGHANSKAIFKPNVYLAKHQWLSRARFHGAGGSAFLYLKNKYDTPLIDSIKTIFAQSPEGQKELFRFIDRKELDKMGANPNPVMALAMKEGYVTRGGSQGKTLVPPKQGSAHGYDPAYPSMHTGFIAVGAGIAAHKNISGMGIKDVAPVVARLLRLDFDAPDGKLFPGIVKEK